MSDPRVEDRADAAPAEVPDLAPPAPEVERVRRGLIGPFTGRQLLLGALAVGLTAVVLVAVSIPISAQAPAAPRTQTGSSFVAFGAAQQGLQPGDRAPELTGTHDGRAVQLRTLQGQVVSLAQFRGHPVWINFFASWCPPCQSETPTLEQVYRQHQAQGLVLLGISVQETSVKDVEAYARTYGLTYPIAFDGTGAIYTTYHIFGLPTQLFLDGNGVVRAVRYGPLTAAQANGIIAPLLAGSAPAPGGAAPSGSPAAGTPGP